MNVNCSTCLELLTASDSLSSAPCGHIFHSVCIIQWLETGKTNCPQCRAKCFERQLRKVFFTEGASVTLDTQCSVNTLQDKIDSLNFKLRCSDTELKSANQARDKAVVQAVAYKEELRDLEIRLNSAKEETAVTIAQNRLLQQEKIFAEKAKKEAKKLREQLESYKHMDNIINESAAAVNEKMHQQCDFSKGARESSVIIVTLKQQMEKNKKELKQVRHDFTKMATNTTELRQQVSMLTQNKRSLESDNERLSNDLKHNEEEMEELRARLRCMKDAITSPSGDPRSSALNRLITNYPAPKDISLTKHFPNEDAEHPSQIANVISEATDMLSPFEIKTKQCGIIGLTKTKSISETRNRLNVSPCKDKTNVRIVNSYSTFTQSSSQPNMNILKPSLTQGVFKRSKIDDLKSPSPIAPSHMFYDGFGGHSKDDSFPVAARKDFKFKPTPYNVSKKPKGISRPKTSKPANSKNDSAQPINNFFSTLTS